MPLHSLPAGRRIIDGLAVLGQALGYDVEPERIVGRSGAAVDLAWYAAGDRGVPIMIFEVESSASSSVANNAMKVLAQDVDDFIKPLFFFHVLLAGGPDNDRINNLRRQWGTHNYRVYRLNDNIESQRLVADVLGQHRRISPTIDVAHLDEALTDRAWQHINRGDVFAHAERSGFVANFLGGYAQRARTDPSLRPIYLHRVQAVHDQGAGLEPERYGGFVGDYIPGLMEVALLIASEVIPDHQGPERLEMWQTRTSGFRTIGHHLGLSRDYDAFVLGVAPCLYGIAGLLMRRNPRSLCWLTTDLQSIVAIERMKGVGEPWLLLSALWLAHLASAALHRSSAAAVHSRERLVAAYELARTVIEEAGGIPTDVLDEPPPYIDIWEPDEWIERLEQARACLPDWSELSGQYASTIHVSPEADSDRFDHWADPFGAALDVLTTDKWPRWSTTILAKALRHMD